MSNDFIKIPSFLGENGINLDGLISPADCGLCEQCEQCGNCEIYCTTCETCMPSCLTCLVCQTCQTSCQKSCQSACEKACQTCLTSQSPATNATLTFSNITANSVRATLSGLDPNYPEYLRVVWFRGGTQIGIDEPVVTSSSINLTGLSPNTSYLIRAEIYDTETHEFLDYLQKSVTTLSLPKLPTPTLDTTQTVKTGNSISVTINPVSGATTYYARINGGSQQSSSGRTFAFSGLLPNTQYLIEIKVSGSGYEDSNWAGYYATTLSAELWSWTTTERNAFNNNGLTTVITYLRWNAFVDKIYEASANDWRTSAADGANLSYASTKMTSSDKTLTANRFNSVRYNIDYRIPTGIGRVYKGDDVLGSYFLTLETKLNQWIAGT